MNAQITLQLAAILIIGISAQWVAWRIRLPSILILLAAGTVAGPFTGWLRPNELFGPLLMPLVSLSVAVILYEGGLSLNLRELRGVGGAFLRLATIGVAVTLAVGTFAAHYVLGFRWPVAALLGAILVVTGPTVIVPMLRHLRLRGKVSSLLKWEGIVVDPIGAILAVAVFTVVHSVTIHEGLGAAAVELGLTVIVGVLFGVLAAALLVLAIARFWVPDSLHNPISLSLVFSAFILANSVQNESGLLAVTIMGIFVANQQRVSIRHINEFEENLTFLLISCLFVVLAARMPPDELHGLQSATGVFVLVMLLLARPISVLLSTWGTNLTWQERCFLSCMAPRGIVAAAIASVLGAELAESGFPEAIEIVPVTFAMVFSTVSIYGLFAKPIALRLGLVHANPQGVLFIGAEKWARAFAKSLAEKGIPSFFIDTDWANVRACRSGGIPAVHGSALADLTRDEIDYSGLGKCLAVTSNDEVNSLACVRFAEDFGRKDCYQISLPAHKVGKHEKLSAEYHGRFLFREDSNIASLDRFAGEDPRIKTTKLTPAFDYSSFCSQHSGEVLPLAVLKPNGTLLIRVAGVSDTPQEGDLIFSLCASDSHKAEFCRSDSIEYHATPKPELG